MPAEIGRGETKGLAEDAVLDRIRELGLSPQAWRNGPDEKYGWHEHSYRKLLYCISGSITFHTNDGDLQLVAGDRLDLPAQTPHAATVGQRGCRCAEAAEHPPWDQPGATNTSDATS